MDLPPINQQENTVQTRMYEPVSDRVSPGYPHRPYATVEVTKCDTNPTSPPEKPPRRNKLARQLQQQQQQQQQQEHGEEKKCPKMRNGSGDSCIDVDHINIQSEKNNFNIKRVSTAVQTSPLVPYRLRFWPKAPRSVKCDPEKHACSRINLQCCCRTLSQLFLSQIGLTVVLVLWALAGAAAFYYTEGPRELQQSTYLYSFQNELAINLATHLNLQVADDNRNISESTIQHYLDKHEKYLLEAVSAGYGEGGGGRIWIYPGCILFAISLLTTLGFGAPVPRTPEGRGAAVLFAAIGIPLHFLLILNIGNLTAIKLQLFVLKKCTTGFPENAETPTPQPTWFKWFPLILIAFYYILGVILFGFARQRDVVDCFMFPLDFTAAGGVGKTPGYLRILYGLYLEVAVMLASLVVSLLQFSASSGIINLGLKLGLLTNT